MIALETPLKTPEAFNAFVADIENQPGYKKPRAFAVGIAHLDKNGNPLDAYFPLVNYESNYGTAAIISNLVGRQHGTCSGWFDFLANRRRIDDFMEHFEAFIGDGKPHANIELFDSLARFEHHRRDPRVRIAFAFIGEEGDDEGPRDVLDIYLRLHLLSLRHVVPNTIGVSPGAIMPKLPNVAWTSDGPYAPSEVSAARLEAQIQSRHLRVYGVDKLPHMLDYVVPPGVRIADSARVRLGAYVGDGTTVMQAGFINFNAGTKGKAMIEGRVSQGVIIGDGSDLGGAASTQGTMSGGSNVVVSIGERTLIGALAGVGIPLGDDCIVAAGLYIMPTTEVQLNDKDGVMIKLVKAHELSGQSGLQFVRLGDGGVIAKPNKKAIELNPILHKN